MKREIIIAICSITGFLVLFDYTFKNTTLQWTSKEVQIIVDRLIAFTAILGLVGTTTLHIHRLRRRRTLLISTIVLGTCWIVLIVGLAVGTTHNIYQWFYQSIMVIGGQAIYGLLGFYAISAILRGFSLRSLETLFMAIIFAIVMIGQTTLGEAISPNLPLIFNWIQEGPAAGANRGIIIGTGLATIGYMIRVLIARETKWIGTGIE